MDGLKIDESLIPKIIGIIVAVIVATVVLIPITEEATATTDTFTNEGYFRMSEIEATDDTAYVLTWDVTTPNTINVNDIPIKMDLTNAPAQVTICFDNDWMLRANITSGSISTITYIPNTGATTLASSTMEVTLEAGSVTAVMDSTTKTEDYTVAYIPDNNGPFVMKKSDNVAYINSNSEMVACGMSRANTSGIFTERGIVFNGSIEDGITPTIWRPPTDTTSTITDVEINATQDGKYIGIYKLSNITMVFNYVDDDQTVQTNLTYSYFLVPAEVTAEKAVHADDMTNTIISTIPIFVVLAILMGIVGLMYFNRNGQ